MSETIKLGTLEFHRENGVEVTVSGREEAMGLLDNFYERDWEALRRVADSLSSTDGAGRGVRAHVHRCEKEIHRLRERTRVLEEAQITPEEADVVLRSLPVVWPEWIDTELQDRLDSARAKCASLAAVAVEDGQGHSGRGTGG